MLIDFPSPEMKTIGLVTRVLKDARTGIEVAAVYVPTTPNPTTGPLVCGTSQAVNDWFDRHVDAINEPNRPIPSGRIPGRWGLYIAIAWTGVSLLVATTLGTWGFLAAVAGLMVSANYSIAHYYMGAMLGMKAFTAAVLGGIGNLPGAMLGGVLLGLIESLGAGYIGDPTGEVFGSN